ncbi:hypothetical protein J6590_043216 [Homalodisca vitripennis]|nr:hypothetical protein J6590_043216 [Homalodisca vitripennis]
MRTRNGGGLEVDGVKKRISETEPRLTNLETEQPSFDDDNQTATCGKCNGRVYVNLSMVCDGFCHRHFHAACEIDDDVFSAINDLDAYVKWFCSKCQNKLDMLFKKSRLMDDSVSCEWPSILNVVLDQLDIQNDNNLNLCNRMDLLTEQYSKLNEKLMEVCSGSQFNSSTPSLNNYSNTDDTRSSIILSNTDRPKGNNNRSIGNKPSLGLRFSKQPQMESEPLHNLNSNKVVQCQTPLGLQSNLTCENEETVSTRTETSSNVNGNIQQNSERIFTNSNREWKTASYRGRRSGNNYKSRPNMVKPITKVKPFSASETKSKESVLQPNSTRFSYSDAVKTVKSNVVHGTRQVSENMLLKPAKKLFWLFLSGLDPSVSSEDIITYLKSLKESETFVCERLETRYNTYSSFKIGVPYALGEELMHPNLWFEGCIIGKYRASRNRPKPTVNISDSFLDNNSQSLRAT